jgi:tRNA-dihydrouridine synthase A
VFIVHARNAWLRGLSPKENREVPPLRHDTVYRLKHDFPRLTLVLNGGVTRDDEVEQHLRQVDGVMLGRQPYHHPWSMAGWDARFFGDAARAALSRDDVEAAMAGYMAGQQAARQVPWWHIARHCMGLWNGTPGARRWRQVWSDAGLKALGADEVRQRARQVRAAACEAGPA